jgi:hypothetical protein
VWRKVVASKGYRSGFKSAVIATSNLCFGIILAVVAYKSY